MTYKKHLITLLLLTFSLLSAEKPPAMNRGTLQGDLYHNEYMGIELTFPTEWKFENREKEREMMDRGNEILAAGDKRKKAAFEASNRNNYTLFFCSKYGLAAKKPNNPFFIGAAEKISIHPHIGNGSQYLWNVQNLLKSSGHKVLTPTTLDTIQGVEFAVMASKKESGLSSIKQKWFAKKFRDYVLLITFTYNNDKEEAELMKIFNTLQVK